MFLKITSPDKCLFEGEVSKVVLPTEAGEIGILPGHIPLVSVIKPGIIKLTPSEHVTNDFLKSAEFLHQDDESLISVSRGLVYVDGKNITVTVGSSVSSTVDSEVELQKMKDNLENEIQQLRAKGSIEDIEKALIDLQKLSVDMKLMKMKGMSK